MIRALVIAQLNAEIKDRTILARSAPFVGLVLLLFAFAFDPDRGVLSQISPGLWWVTVTFAAMFIFVRDARNDKEARFISQFGVSSHLVFIARVITNTALTFIVTALSGLGVFFLFSPDIDGVLNLFVVSILGTLSVSTIGAIYSPIVSKLHDSGQLLSLVVIPVLIPALLAAIQATDAAINQATRESWNWTLLLAIFCVLFFATGILASDSLED